MSRLDGIVEVEYSYQSNSNDVEFRNFQQEQLERPRIVRNDDGISIIGVLTSIHGPLATQSLDGPHP